MSPEELVSDFIVKNHAANGMEVRGTAPGMVTVALPYHVEEIDSFVTELRDYFNAGVDMRATERGVELDVYPHSFESVAGEPSSRVSKPPTCCFAWWCVIYSFIAVALCFCVRWLFIS
tara:strand:- start:1330 stop:1683 length:354 start_codon:yes stop_codon:yes gene_type:complete